MKRHRIISCSIGLLAACTGSSEDRTPVEESDNPIDQIFARLEPLHAEAPKLEKGTPSAPVMTGDFQCIDTPIKEVRRFDQMIGQLSIGDVVWPGAMLRGDSVYSGRLTPMPLARAP